MSKSRNVSFHLKESLIYQSEFDTVNCEKISVADINNDNEQEIILIRNNSSPTEELAEILIYNMEFNLIAYECWNGSVMDFAIGDINNDSLIEIITAGRIKDSKPIIRIYKYNESYKGNLGLLLQTSWNSPKGLFSTAQNVYIGDINADGDIEIIALSIVEGHESGSGYAQLRLYDTKMNLKKITRWSPLYGNVARLGHHIAVYDIDNDGKKELIVFVNFNHEGKRKSDLRILDHDLKIKEICNNFIESMHVTGMVIEDIDNDSICEIIFAGNRFAERSHVWESQIIVLDNTLKKKDTIISRTFRHSWIWNIQIIDIDKDGLNEIITYGSTSLTGRDLQDSNMMGEIILKDGKSLSNKDMFIWQIYPGKYTCPSNGFVFADRNYKFITATSRSSWKYTANELEIRVMDYIPVHKSIDNFTNFINSANEKDVDKLSSFISLDDENFVPLVLEALAICDSQKAVIPIGKLLEQDKVFLRAIEILRGIGAEAIPQFRKAGFAITDDWIIISPFDNSKNNGFDKEYPPELCFDISAFYAGKDRIVKWGRIGEDKWDDRRWDIYFDLAYARFDSFERTGIEFNWNNLRTESVAYALTYINVAHDMPAQIRIGSSDGIKLWVNGKLKHANNVKRQAIPDQDIIPVSFVKGRNSVMLKVCNIRTNKWGFYFRITDLEGKPIPDISYKQPDSSYIHNQMLNHEQLLSLLDSDDEKLRCFSAIELVKSGDKRGNEELVSLLSANDISVQAKSALELTFNGDKRGVEPLVKLSAYQDELFKLTASYALSRIDDKRAEEYSIFNLKDNFGRNLIRIDVAHKAEWFRLSPIYKEEETAHVDVGTNIQFHLGENVSAKCASIRSFGIREPKYRMMGIGGISLKMACDLMKEAGHSCSIVSTGTKLVAHRLYCKNGYFDRRLQWRYEKRLNSDEIVKDKNDIIFREYNDSDKNEILRLREQYLINTIGPNYWSPRANFDSKIKVLESSDGIIGYADVNIDPFEPIADINILHIDNDFGEQKKAMKAMLSGIHKFALMEGKKLVTWNYPSVIDRSILIEMGYEIEPSTLRYGWVGMFRIIDLTKFLQEISYLLTYRIQKSIHARWCGTLGINGSSLKSTIVFDKDGVMGIDNAFSEKADIIISADDRTITEILSSNGDIWKLYRQHKLTTYPVFNERVRTLIEILFPIMPCKQSGWW
ncbi:MAG: hypothetical protein ACUVWN_09855 [bacterium]